MTTSNSYQKFHKAAGRAEPVFLADRPADYVFSTAIQQAYNRYSSKPHGVTPFLHNQKTIISVCGTLLQLLHSIMLSRYHHHSGIPHDACVVVTYVGEQLHLKHQHGDWKSYHYNMPLWWFHVWRAAITIFCSSRHISWSIHRKNH
jgi:hypothetical protein